MQWNPGSGAHWSLPTGAWSSAVTSVPVPRLGTSKWEEPGIMLQGIRPGQGSQNREGKGFGATSSSRISSVEGQARHKANYCPPDLQVPQSGPPRVPHCSTPVLPSMRFNLLCPSSSFCPIFLSRTLCLLHSGVQPTRNSPAVPAWVAVSEICKGKSSAPQAMSWAGIPEQKPSIREEGWLEERYLAGFP